MPLTRHFLDWTQHALPAAADYVIQRYAQADELDLSRVILVFPGRRAARRMLELLVQKCSAQWPGFFPPRMVTFQQFPEMLYPQQFQLADDLTQLLVWKQALGSIPARELSAALPSIPADEAVPAWLALCESLRRQHNELAADGMEFDRVYEELSKHGNESEALRWKALRRIQSEYLMRMDDLKLWDRQAARLIAVEQNECSTESDIILIGTVDMNRIVRQMLDQVSDRVTALIHCDPEEADAFDEYGCLIPEKWQSYCLNVPLEITRITDAPTEQASQVVHEIAALNGRFRADDISVGVANENLVPPILQFMSDAGVAGRWPVGMLVRGSRPWQLLSAVARHLASARDGQPPDFATLSDLVRHPDMGVRINQLPVISDQARTESIRQTQSARRSGASDWLTHLDEYLAEHLQIVPGVLHGRDLRAQVVGAICSCVEQGLTQLLPVAQRPGPEIRTAARKKSAPATGRKRQLRLDESLESSDQTVADILNRKLPLVHWAEGCLRLLSWVYQDQTLHEGNQADQGIVACVEAIQNTVESLRRIPAAIMPKVACGQALQLILKEIGEVAIPPEHDDEAIDLLGWLELPLDDSPVLILTGFNEGYVPESVNSDVFLPNSFRSQLGLNDNNRRYARDAYALASLMHCRRKIVLISGRRDGQGNPLSPSRLWFAADPSTLPFRVRLFFDPEFAAQQSSQTIPTADELHLPLAKGRQISQFTVPEPPLIAAAPSEISVTAFREYLYCPYRYYLRRELRLTAIEDETRELTAPAFGSLMHEVLNRFGQSSVRDSTTSEAIELMLLTELQKLATLRFGRNRSATVTVQLKMLENRLQEFARWQATTASEGWRIIHTEADLRYTEFRDIKDRSVALIGRVDRIDQHLTSKEWRILDYKTSETAEKPETTHRTREEWVDLQLPLYRLLVRSIGIDGDLQLGYIHLPGDLSRIGCSIASWELADLESAELKAMEIAADILDLRIDRVAPGEEQRATEFSRVCQDTVIDRNIPWLAQWKGRRDLS